MSEHFLMLCCCSVTQSRPALCNPMDCSIAGLPVPHHLPKFAQGHVHCVSDAVQPSYPLMPSFPSALNLPQLQELVQWVVCESDDQNKEIDIIPELVWLLTPVFLPGEFHGQRSLVDYNLWGSRLRHDQTHAHTRTCTHTHMHTHTHIHLPF